MVSYRKVIDCRWFRTVQPCDIAISGNEEGVLDIAILHNVQSHGHRDTPEFREELRLMLCDEGKLQQAVAFQENSGHAPGPTEV
jgi:hypothetical protein